MRALRCCENGRLAEPTTTEWTAEPIRAYSDMRNIKPMRLSLMYSLFSLPWEQQEPAAAEWQWYPAKGTIENAGT